MDLEKVIERIRHDLKSQYHATLAMLHQAIAATPDDLWYSGEYTNTFWQLAYHTLFFTHLYCQVDEASFVAWEHHQTASQYPDAIPGDPDPASNLPLLPDPYTKAQVLEYWKFCDDHINEWVNAIDVLSQESGFSWYKVSKLEHQIVNIRHIEHGTAQLADRLRSKTGTGINWVGKKHDLV
jgi:hypothetical protein